MTETGRKATAAVAAALAMMVTQEANAQGAPTAAANRREATVLIHIANYAALPSEILDGAKARVVSIYNAIGVRTVWVDGPATDRHHGQQHLTILLLSRDMAQNKISAEGLSDHVLGQAHLPSGRAHIFCDRIAAMPVASRSLSIPLGDVIAHEVGHLLLQTNSHSRSGVMRAQMDVQAIRLQHFDKAQAGTIHATLTQQTTRMTAR